MRDRLLGVTDTTSMDDLGAIRLLDDPVRRRLYEWVVAQPDAVGREQAAAATGISRSLAAFHLDKLADAGLLEAGYRRLTGRVGPGAGRPARVYQRADREFSITLPERRYVAAADLFATAIERMGDGAPPPALADSAAAAGSELAASTAAASVSGSSEDRLVAALEAAGYEPFEDGAGSIRLRNCPFHALVEDHRTLVCGTNLELARGIVSGVGASDWEARLDPQPGLCCVAFAHR
jgi:predicted ArsR family transcriptional regulator